MKRTVLMAAMAGLMSVAMAQTVTWSNDPGGVAVATDAFDNVFTARWDYNMAGDIYVAKRNASGQLLWEVRYDNIDTNMHEVATWVGSDAWGNVLVSGTLRSGYSSPVSANSILMKFAPDGRLLWRRVYDQYFDGSSTRKLLVDEAGYIYVLGVGSMASGQRTTVRKFDPNGNTTWAWFDPVGLGWPLNAKLTPDGALIISARVLYGSFNGYAKIDRQGRTLWTLPGVASLTAGDAAGDASGNSYLIDSNYAARTGSLVRKLGPDGNLLWQRSHPMAGLRVEVGPDAAPVVSGYPNAGMSGAAFMKFSPDGVLQWTNLDADGATVALLGHAQMRLDASGSAYLAAGNMSQMGVTKVYGNGASAWTTLVPYGYAQGMAFGSQQQVYVTGGSTARINQLAVTTPPPPPPPPPAPPPPAPPPVVVAADLRLTLVDAPDPARVGSPMTLTATVANAGPSTAGLVVFKAALPAGVKFLGAVSSQGSCSGTTSLNCALGSLASGARATVTVTLRPQTRGTLTAQGSVASATADPVAANNSASTTTLVKR